MKSITTLLLGLTAVLLLVLIAAAANSADAAISAYVELREQPESVTDIVMRSRTTASAPAPERSSGLWLGAGFLAITLVVIGSLLALMFGGGSLLRQWRLAFRRSRARVPAYPPGPAAAHQPPYPPYPTTPLTPTTPPAEQLPPWTDDGY